MRMYTDGLAQDCGNSNVLAMESPQSPTKPSVCSQLIDSECLQVS